MIKPEKLQRPRLTLEELAQLDEDVTTIASMRAYDDFYAFRQVVNQGMLCNWFTYEIAKELQRLSDDYEAGKRPILVLCCPPQHGKSLNVIDLIAWMVGRDPNRKVIYTSFSDRLCLRANLRIQRTLDTQRYRRIFPDTALSQVKGSGYLRNTDMLEFVAHQGYFRNTTVGGPITGEELDIGVIDDPIKGRSDANSLIVRDKTWGWLTDDMLSRFSEHAGLLMILTRWHVDDPAGRLIEYFGEQVRVVTYKAHS